MYKLWRFALPYSMMIVGLLLVVVGVHLLTTSEFEHVRLGLSSSSTRELFTRAVQLAVEKDDVWLARRLDSMVDTYQESQVLGVGEEVESLLYPDRAWEERLLIINGFLTQQPTFVEAMVEKVVVLNQLGRAREAREVVIEVIEQDPNHPLSDVLQKFGKGK